jgi:tartrate dehydratase alpha subunit/fumarate hydratase class I-like protein
MSSFNYTEILPLAKNDPEYRLVTTEGITTTTIGERTFLNIDDSVLEKVAYEAIHDISHYLRTGHLEQLKKIIDDPNASPNDRFVAIDLMKNANIAAGGILPMCQDTGTAIVSAKRGSQILTDGPDEVALSRGIYNAYQKLNLRYSQLSPLNMWDEKNTGDNLPAQIEIYSDTKPGHENSYEMLFIAKGGGSANKSYLYQETKAVLNQESFLRFMDEKLRLIGTSACPPYHLAIVVGGTSAEYALKVSKLASTKYLDSLPTEGGPKRNIWPELEMINKFKKLGFIDTFRSIQADPRSGLTEDTDLNLMRWNQKFKEKMFRYDAIFYKPATNPANTYQIAASEIMGTEVAYLSEENSRWFIDIISEKKDLALFKGLKYNGEKLPLIPINPSDHFGVITSFAKIPAKQVAKPLEQSGKGYNISSKTKTKYVLRKR